MTGLSKIEVNTYLNDLIKNVDVKTLSTKNLASFEKALNEYFSELENGIIEYARSSNILLDDTKKQNLWFVSERSPLIYKDIKRKGGGVVAQFSKVKDNGSTELKYFFPNTSQVAYLETGELYLRILSAGKTIHENIYLPKLLPVLPNKIG